MMRTWILTSALWIGSLATLLPAVVQDELVLEEQVRATVADLLEHIGGGNVSALPSHFTPDAILIVARKREGKFTNTIQTVETWMTSLRENPDRPPFEERLTNIEVTLESSQIALLRADFEIVREGKVVSSGVDLFTLLRHGDEWKVAALAYTNLLGPLSR